MGKVHIDLNNKAILVTGSPGFIGANLVLRLLKEMTGGTVISLDNMNDYYDPALKEYRLGLIEKAAERSQAKHVFVKGSIADKTIVDRVFAEYKPDVVVNLAAQAGVRYSIDHPDMYIESNIIGFYNLLEACRYNPVEHLVYASSSSVYGGNRKVPFSTEDKVDHPVSLYAATKKSNELMAHAYSYIFGLPVTGLRFFTVYGPWGRPDMSPFLFINGILKGDPIKVFNNGDMLRDFTFIDDIVKSVTGIIHVTPECNKEWDNSNPDAASSCAPYRIYNVGNQNPTRLLDYISAIENELGMKAIKQMEPMQPGDVYQTYADSSALANATGFTPNTSLQEGIHKTIKWFRGYYKV